MTIEQPRTVSLNKYSENVMTNTSIKRFFVLFIEYLRYILYPLHIVTASASLL